MYWPKLNMSELSLSHTIRNMFSFEKHKKKSLKVQYKRKRKDQFSKRYHVCRTGKFAGLPNLYRLLETDTIEELYFPKTSCRNLGYRA